MKLLSRHYLDGDYDRVEARAEKRGYKQLQRVVAYITLPPYQDPYAHLVTRKPPNTRPNPQYSAQKRFIDYDSYGKCHNCSKLSGLWDFINDDFTGKSLCDDCWMQHTKELP